MDHKQVALGHIVKLVVSLDETLCLGVQYTAHARELQTFW